MIDESTYISTESHIILYVKYCLKGNIKIRYLKLLQLTSNDSNSIYEAIIKLFEKNGIYISIGIYFIFKSM